MLGTQLTELLDAAPAGVSDALDLVTGFDEGLVHGFARVGDECSAALSAIAGALATTPLGERVGEAADKVAAGSAGDEHLVALAGARAALFGAVHDALLARFDTATGRARAPWVSPPPAGDQAANLLAGSRSWLRELAITGWRGVDHDLVSAVNQVLQAILADPTLRRLGVLLDGLATELQACAPVVTMDRLPARRWADLWARAMLLSQPGGLPGTEPATPVSGRLLVLGVDVHEHSTAVQIQVHGILEPTGDAPTRLVRTSIAVAKVDTIVGPAIWSLLRNHPVLLAGLAGHRSLDVVDVPLLTSGDLVWHDDRAEVGAPADPFAIARVQLAGALAPPVPPLDRHPVRIAEPVLLEGYTPVVDDSGQVALDLGGQVLAVAVDRLPSCGPLKPDLVGGSSACIGLVRWDGSGWRLQPLAVQTTVKRKTVVVHTGDWAAPTDPKTAKAVAAAGDAVAVLRERAGRLLRR